jgi:hypothetical protein
MWERSLRQQNQHHVHRVHQERLLRQRLLLHVQRVHRVIIPLQQDQLSAHCVVLDNIAVSQALQHVLNVILVITIHLLDQLPVRLVL